MVQGPKYIYTRRSRDHEQIYTIRSKAHYDLHKKVQGPKYINKQEGNHNKSTWKDPGAIIYLQGEDSGTYLHEKVQGPLFSTQEGSGPNISKN